METLTITVSESLKAFVEAEVAAGHYTTADELIGTLLREAQKRKARERVDALLLEGLDSGESAPMTEQDWEDLRRNLQQNGSEGAEE